MNENLILVQSTLFNEQSIGRGKWTIFNPENNKSVVAVGKNKFPEILNILIENGKIPEELKESHGWLFQRKKNYQKELSDLYWLSTYNAEFRDYTRKDWFQRDNETMKFFSTYGLPPEPTTFRGNSFVEKYEDFPLDFEGNEFEQLKKILFFLFQPKEIISGANPSSKKVVPSGGGKHPVEISLKFPKGVVDFPQGEFAYDINSHDFLKISNEFSVYEKNIEIRLSLRVERAMWRYRDMRSFRALFLDLGHVISMLNSLCLFVGWSVDNVRICSPDFKNNGWIEEPAIISATIRAEKKKYGIIHVENQDSIGTESVVQVITSPFVYFRILESKILAHTDYLQRNDVEISKREFELLTHALPSRRGDRNIEVDVLCSYFHISKNRLKELMERGLLLPLEQGIELHKQVMKWSSKNWYINLLFLLNQVTGSNTEINNKKIQFQETPVVQLNRQTERSLLSSEVSSEKIEELENILSACKELSMKVFINLRNVQGREKKNLEIYSDKEMEILSVEKVRKIVTNQLFAGKGAIDVFLVREFEQSNYLSRLVELGIIAQNIITRATEIELGVFMTPAINDECAKELLELDSENFAIYYLGVGNV